MASLDENIPVFLVSYGKLWYCGMVQQLPETISDHLLVLLILDGSVSSSDASVPTVRE